MKRIFPILIFLILATSCSKDEPIVEVPTNTQVDNSSLEFYIYECKTIHCTEKIPISNLNIEIYEIKEDAEAGINPIKTAVSNADGKATISIINSERVYVKIDFEEFGTYISLQRLANNATVSYHDVRCLSGYAYQSNDDNQLIQNHISLGRPAVGQQSTYKYYQNNNHISYTPLEYSDVELNVRIVDQIDVNRFVVRESIDSIFGLLGSPIYPQSKVVTNEWHFDNDSLHILPYAEDYKGSFVWNISGDYYPREANGYSFSLIRGSENGIDMTTENVSINDGCEGTSYVEDYILFGNEYNELITDIVTYTFADGPLKMRVYNLNDGVVRSLDFFSGMSLATHGFDLVLD